MNYSPLTHRTCSAAVVLLILMQGHSDKGRHKNNIHFELRHKGHQGNEFQEVSTELLPLQISIQPHTMSPECGHNPRLGVRQVSDELARNGPAAEPKHEPSALSGNKEAHSETTQTKQTMQQVGSCLKPVTVPYTTSFISRRTLRIRNL